jgi:membrane protease YdiL (CAAX protease family)
MKISILALEQMNLETLSSPFSETVLQGIKAFVLFVIGWNIIPLIALPYFFSTLDITSLLIMTNLLILILPIGYYYQHRRNYTKLKSTSRSAVDIYGLLIEFDQISFYGLLILIVIIEEVFFRYFVIEYLRVKMSDQNAIVISSLFFGFIHIFNPLSFLNAFLQGLILGQVKTKTGSIRSTIILHGAYNLLLITFI